MPLIPKASAVYIDADQALPLVSKIFFPTKPSLCSASLEEIFCTIRFVAWLGLCALWHWESFQVTIWILHSATKQMLRCPWHQLEILSWLNASSGTVNLLVPLVRQCVKNATRLEAGEASLGPLHVPKNVPVGVWLRNSVSHVSKKAFETSLRDFLESKGLEWDSCFEKGMVKTREVMKIETSTSSTRSRCKQLTDTNRY